jgi:hypothetical protein
MHRHGLGQGSHALAGLGELETHEMKVWWGIRLLGKGIL